jgi:murein DD-endopeptidase MepM/ murein hydrolase activator NlpD
VSERAVQRAAVALGVVVLALVVGVVSVAVDAVGGLQARDLAQRNRLLTQELTRIQEKVATLESMVDRVQSRDAEVRSLAGLEPLDEDVLQVGVGGPGGGEPGAHPLHRMDAELGNTAFAVEYDVSALQRRARLLLGSLGETRDSLSHQRDLLLSTPTLFPTAGTLSSRFSKARLHPIMNEVLPHPGIDIAAPRGTPILAAGQGRVARAGWASGYGQMVEIDHGFGYTTVYAHASRLLVRAGQEVERGDVIAQVGRTGTATANHLHYEVRLNGKQQNPLNYFLPGTLR